MTFFLDFEAFIWTIFKAVITQQALGLEQSHDLQNLGLGQSHDLHNLGLKNT